MDMNAWCYGQFTHAASLPLLVAPQELALTRRTPVCSVYASGTSLRDSLCLLQVAPQELALTRRTPALLMLHNCAHDAWNYDVCYLSNAVLFWWALTWARLPKEDPCVSGLLCICTPWFLFFIIADLSWMRKICLCMCVGSPLSARSRLLCLPDTCWMCCGVWPKALWYL